MPAANSDLTRAINQFNILNEIRKHEGISRVELAELTGQSRASVTNITALLLHEGVITEARQAEGSGRGRKRTLLVLNPKAAYVAGVKISAYQISFAVVDFRGEVVSSLIMPVRTGERSEAFVADVIEDGVRHCVADARLHMDDICGIGIGIPGFVDKKTGATHWTPLYTREAKPLKDRVHERLNVDVYIDNDANAVTQGLQWFGLGAGVDNFLVVTLEHGVGMGIVVGGRIHRGASGIGAEFGHVVLRPGGEPCRCGKLGCVEAYVSDISLVRRAREVISRRRGETPNVETLTIQDVTAMAANGDAGLKKLFREGGEVLGQGVAGLMQIFNPERIIVTGEGVRAGELVFAPMRRAIKQHANKEMAAATEIIVQNWADDDWARGAAGFVLSELYKSPLDIDLHSGHKATGRSGREEQP